jgi:hypothetical protein
MSDARLTSDPSTFRRSVQLLRRPALATPEARLMAAVLEDAIREYQLLVLRGARRMALAELRAWFASDAQDHPFSFTAICDALDIDAHWLRAGLARWHAGRVREALGAPVAGYVAA